MKVLILLMMMVPLNSNASWFSFDEPRKLYPVKSVCEIEQDSTCYNSDEYNPKYYKSQLFGSPVVDEDKKAAFDLKMLKRKNINDIVSAAKFRMNSRDCSEISTPVIRDMCIIIKGHNVNL